MKGILEHIEKKLSTATEIICQADELNKYLRGTEGFDCYPDKKRKLLAVVKVTTASDVQSLLLLANNPELSFVIYPISSGRNWGYGTSQPVQISANCIILDLSKLTNIDFDEELGLVTVEPGVTQQHLSDYLAQRGDKHMVPVTGAGPDCSLIGNAIERGYGITPYTDHFAAVTAVVGFWANGSPYQSAISELDASENSLVNKTYKWGLGPYLEGLFTQSNLGIVTQMTLRLAAVKPAFTSFFIQLKSDDLLEDVIPLIRQVLRDYEGIVGSINLMDQRRLLSMFAVNPQGTASHKVMTQQDITRLANENDTPPWTIIGSIYATKRVLKAVKIEVKQIFNQVPHRIVFSDSALISLGNTVFEHTPEFIINKSKKLLMIKKQLSSFEKGKEIMLGKPNRVALNLAYWRHKDADNFDNKIRSPAYDRCGLLWYAPLVVMKPEILREYVEFVRAVCPQFNIEPFITFTNLRHDCVDSTIPIVFDLDNPQAVTDAHQCLEKLVTQGLKKGYVPYRLNIDQQLTLINGGTDFWGSVNKIKKALDPNEVLSPQRYNPQ